MSTPNATMQRLDDQIEWYDKRSMSNQRAFKWLKGIEIVGAALVPFAAGASAPAVITGALGVLVVVLEGVQQLNQYHHNWIIYRSTCENLKHEKFLYLAKAGPYAAVNDPQALLAERIESLISQEHAKWIAGREQVAKSTGPAHQAGG
jgi:hypothetical protein